MSFLGNRARTSGGAGVADACYDARTPGLPHAVGANAVGPGCGRLYVFVARGGKMRAGARGHRFLSFLRGAGVPLGSGRGAIRVHLSRTQLRLVLAGEVGFGLSIRFQTWVHSCNGSGRLGVPRSPEALRHLLSPGTRPETTEKRSPQDRRARTVPPAPPAPQNPAPPAPQHTHTQSGVRESTAPRTRTPPRALSRCWPRTACLQTPNSARQPCSPSIPLRQGLRRAQRARGTPRSYTE